ncbi:MAG: hypothetical protein NTZ32_00945 [Planctomycetales bacterium]|nr:hypothetical protein [Planctomycetales bacterium]
MRELTLAQAFILLTFVLVGCDSVTVPANSPSSIGPAVVSKSEDSRDQGDLAASWERFIATAKSKESDATNNYVQRRSGRPGSVKVKWGITDLVKSDSLTAPYIGKVDLTVFLTDEFSTGRFQYSLQFVSIGNKWGYRGGKKQRFDRSGSDDHPLDYPELEDEIRVLFTSMF